ncbi:hypothetical protein ABIA54_004904 [Pseudomonas sp. EB276 TE3739]
MEASNQPINLPYHPPRRFLDRSLIPAQKPTLLSNRLLKSLSTSDMLLKPPKYSTAQATPSCPCPRPRNLRRCHHPDMQVWHLDVTFNIELQDFCKRDYPAKRGIGRVPAIDQDDAVGRLFGQHVPGNPAAAISQASADFQLQIPVRMSDELIYQAHCFAPERVAFFLAQSDDFLVVCPQRFSNGLQQRGFADAFGAIQSNKQRTSHCSQTSTGSSEHSNGFQVEPLLLRWTPKPETRRNL